MTLENKTTNKVSLPGKRVSCPEPIGVPLLPVLVIAGAILATVFNSSAHSAIFPHKWISDSVVSGKTGVSVASPTAQDNLMEPFYVRNELKH